LPYLHHSKIKISLFTLILNSPRQFN
jgi:hypothetical protein